MIGKGAGEEEDRNLFHKQEKEDNLKKKVNICTSAGVLSYQKNNENCPKIFRSSLRKLKQELFLLYNLDCDTESCCNYILRPRVCLYDEYTQVGVSSFIHFVKIFGRPIAISVRH